MKLISKRIICKPDSIYNLHVENNHNYIANGIVVSNCHTAQANTISTILQSCDKAKFRFGLTGTLPTNRLDQMNVKSFIGPTLKTFTGKDLADLNFVSKCTIKQLHIKYITEYRGSYNDIRNKVFVNPFRMSIIKGLCKKTENSVLILVDRVDKEGKILYNYLNEELPYKEVVFISGKDKSELRDLWRRQMNIKDNIICISTYPIFQQGVNIPSLKEIILASSTKSFVRVIQSLGRTLRKHHSKELDGAVLWDICDDVKHLEDHAAQRFRHYVKEKYDVKESYLSERVN